MIFCFMNITIVLKSFHRFVFINGMAFYEYDHAFLTWYNVKGNTKYKNISMETKIEEIIRIAANS